MVHHPIDFTNDVESVEAIQSATIFSDKIIID